MNEQPNENPTPEAQGGVGSNAWLGRRTFEQWFDQFKVCVNPYDEPIEDVLQLAYDDLHQWFLNE